MNPRLIRSIYFVNPRFLLLIAIGWRSFTNPFFPEGVEGSLGEIQVGQIEKTTYEARAKTSINEADSLALVALYESTDGINWHDDTNWLQAPVYTWYGIEVENGRVTRIELADNHLRFPFAGNSIPSDIRNLTELQVLDLQSNRLRGAVPVEVAQLPRLEQLFLNDNDLEDLPDLGGLAFLSEVSVENNDLTFEDLEPNVGQAFSITYAPQKIISMPPLPRVAYEGNRVDLHVPVGGTNNRYQWYLDGVALQGATSDRYIIEQVSMSNVGPYKLEITNSLVPDLTLMTSSKTLSLYEPYDYQWLDIGAYHHVYAGAGALSWGPIAEEGMKYPAILRHSGHLSANGFWIGVKDWTDPEGMHHPYYVTRIGPRSDAELGQDVVTFPIQNRLIGRYEDTVVEVNGKSSYDNTAVLEEVDPGIPADRMIHNVHNMSVGITVDRKVYAYTNEYHDNYHLIDYEYCNTGNIDGDEEIELPDQTLHDVVFFRIHRWRGNEQAAWASRSDQVWGRYSLFDVVGDGHEAYPVDFTAQYGWYGHNILTSSEAGYNNLGSPLFTDHNNYVADGDSVGRLAGPTMVGRVTIHADNSPMDKTYNPARQPHVLGWMDNDNAVSLPIRWSDITPQDFYERGILGVESPVRNPGCTTCTGRIYPHFADLIQPDGAFWEPHECCSLVDALAGGFSPTTGYGPYEMGPGECVNIVVAEGIDGLSFDAATKIGQAYKRAGSNRETELIAYDANADGLIDTTPFNYDNVFVGTEAQTKNQWVMSARDSLFQTFYRARDLFTASNGMSAYPIAEPPRAPYRFSLWGRPDRVDLEWTPAPDGPVVQHWELYRTESREDNLYVNGCLENPSVACGYQLAATLPPETTSYADTDLSAGIDYFYYIQGVGEAQPEDPDAVNGTPGGAPLRSGRYLTQTYTPVSLQTGTATGDTDPPDQFRLDGNYPNPFSADTKIRYVLPTASDVELVVYDILGREVDVLVREHQAVGTHEFVYSGAGLASGVYIYVLRAGAYRAVGKMLLAR